MKHVQYSKKFLEDLENITVYTAQMWGANQAKVYLKDIRDKVHQIANDDAIVQFAYSETWFVEGTRKPTSHHFRVNKRNIENNKNFT